MPATAANEPEFNEAPAPALRPVGPPPEVFYHQVQAIVPATEGWFAEVENSDPLPVVAWASADLHAMGNDGTARVLTNGDVPDRHMVGIVVMGDEVFPAPDLERFRRYFRTPTR